MKFEFITIKIPLFSVADIEKIKQCYPDAHSIKLNYLEMTATVVLKKTLAFSEKNATITE